MRASHRLWEVAARSYPAHGIGGRADLPLPGEVVLQAGGFVVLVSFLAVGLLWQRPKFGVPAVAGGAGAARGEGGGGAGGGGGWGGGGGRGGRGRGPGRAAASGPVGRCRVPSS